MAKNRGSVMLKSYKNLREKLSPRERRKTDEHLQDLRKQYPLGYFRNEAQLTQASVAQNLAISQAAISQREGQSDFMVSTFFRHIRAIGGDAQINVRVGSKCYSMKFCDGLQDPWSVQRASKTSEMGVKNGWETLKDRSLNYMSNQIHRPANDDEFAENWQFTKLVSALHG